MNRHSRRRLHRDLDAYLAFWAAVERPIVPSSIDRLMPITLGGWKNYFAPDPSVEGSTPSDV